VDDSVLSNDSINQLCDNNLYEVNALSYVAGYVIKDALSCSKCSF